MTKVWQSTYHLQINYDVNWVDGIYDGKLDGMELHENTICYQTLLEDYKLRKEGAITYVSPNRDPKQILK